MPQITGFITGIRMGTYPYCLNIDPATDDTDFNGVSATFYVSQAKGLKEKVRRAELRRRADEYRLFVFRFTDAELPEGWQDSELLWELKDDFSETGKNRP